MWAEVKIPDSCKGWVTGTLAKMEPKVRKIRKQIIYIYIHKANNDSSFHPTKATVGASCDAWSRLSIQDACCLLCFLLALEHPKLVLVESLPR